MLWYGMSYVLVREWNWVLCPRSYRLSNRYCTAVAIDDLSADGTAKRE